MATSFQKGCWAFYDFANSSYPAIITTFIFATYFTKAIAPDEITATSFWGYMTGLSAFSIALFAPIFGAIADHSGRRKLWIFIFTFLCMICCVMLWGAKPDPAYMLYALVLVGLATFGFEMAMVFYNAMLPDLAGSKSIGRLSGWAWGLGYFGGLIGLALILVLFVQTDTPLFGLDPETSEHIRISGPFVAVWLFIFALPLFLFVPDIKSEKTLKDAVGDGLENLKRTLKNWKTDKDVFRFLFARMIYTDGLNTLFAFGGIYAAGTFNMDFNELIMFGIMINVTAGLGAFVFGWLDDKSGPKKVIMISIFSLCVLSTLALIVDDKTHFLIIALFLGLFMGPAQAASRSYMGHASPAEKRNSFFGLYALSGKATAFIGPLMVAFATDMFQSQRAGMATILAFFVIGLVLMARLPDIRGKIVQT